MSALSRRLSANTSPPRTADTHSLRVEQELVFIRHTQGESQPPPTWSHSLWFSTILSVHVVARSKSVQSKWPLPTSTHLNKGALDAQVTAQRIPQWELPPCPLTFPCFVLQCPKSSQCLDKPQVGLCYVLGVLAQTEITRVAEENVTLPCQHRLGLLGEQSLDIEWLLNHSEQRKSVLISYSAGRIYEGENARGRYSFASNFLAGDAAILITSLQPSDAGQYICKVKNAGQYEWNHIRLKVLVKPSEPECQIDGELLAGKSITLLCNTSAGTAPISYRWQRMKYREDVTVAMPKTARIDNPQRLMLQNLTIADNGSYLCVVSNDAGRRSCSLHLIIKSDTVNVGFLAGVTCGAVASVILVCIALWLLFRKKELKKREEDEFLNEIR
ncbi:CXADR-like membrane [Pelobates cultripes]|nr:CXADR-like membrane [Pelobates cultripes]